MRLLKQLLLAFAIIITSVVLCAIGGGFIGKLIAVKFPNYYPSVFPAAATQPYFDASEMGIATGIGQGAAAGLLVGAVVVLALAIANRRRDGLGR
ncbi:MAG: hypothetical protein JWP03_4516 [Phycisphaerales bacterium]|jgi:hypothetical protein|nr:hypothetical protein [Phycisphaerales bacterium]